MSTITIRNPAAPASEPQVDLIARLARERGITATVVTTMGEASAEISRLKAIPMPERPKAATGYYRRGSDYVVIVATRDGKRTYAKILTKGTTASGNAKWSWEYAPGVAASLAGDTPVTLEEAAQWSHLHGVCLKCCRALKDPNSVTRGLGPVCAKAFA